MVVMVVGDHDNIHRGKLLRLHVVVVLVVVVAVVVVVVVVVVMVVVVMVMVMLAALQFLASLAVFGVNVGVSGCKNCVFGVGAM